MDAFAAGQNPHSGGTTLGEGAENRVEAVTEGVGCITAGGLYFPFTYHRHAMRSKMIRLGHKPFKITRVIFCGGKWAVSSFLSASARCILQPPKGKMKMQNVQGKVAVITGAASGVGKHLALRLAKAGAKLVLADIEADALNAAVEDVKASGAEVIGHVTDVAHREAVDSLRDRAFGHFGKVHLLFNNAGIGGNGGPTAWETTEKAFRWAMDVNFFGPLNGILSFMPRLIAQDEEVLVAATSSAAGIIFPPAAPAYSASKAALVALMEVMGMQLMLAGSKVQAAILFPGPNVVETRLFSSHRNLQPEYADPVIAAGSGVNDAAQFQAMMKQFLGRDVELTQPEDFAEEAYQSILRGDFYILPLNENTKAAIRKRTEDMIERRPLSIPDMF